MRVPISTKQIAAAFNEWMRRYTEEPERFEREFQSVERFLTEVASGQEPSYGETCAAYLKTLVTDLAKGVQP